MGLIVKRAAVPAPAQASKSRAHSLERTIKFKLIVSICFVSSFLGIAQQSMALPPETEAGIKQFVMKSPSVFGLKTEIEFLEPAMGIASCQGGTVEITVPPGVRLWGRVGIQLRCAKAAWLINVPVYIHAYGSYVVAAKYIPMGKKLDSGDLKMIDGDLTTLSDDVLRTPKDGIDKAITRSLQMGASVGLNDLRQTAVIRNGDPVRIQLTGKDFQVSGEGVAQSDGMVNDMVRIRLNDGQMLQGRVIRAGVVVVNLE